MVYSLNVWGLFGYVKKKDTPVTQQGDSSDSSVGENSRETVQSEATTSASSAQDGAVFSFKLDGPETFESDSDELQHAQHQVPVNSEPSTSSQEEAAMADSTEDNDMNLELDEKFDGAGFVSISSIKAMPKFNTARRSSKRFVIGDELEDASPETEVLLTVPNPDWLRASAKLKPGTTLT